MSHGNLNLEHIAKVAGHGKLKVEIEKGEVKDVKLNIFESARFFEAILKGRTVSDAARISSRICGVCSQAHYLTAVRAIENALNIDPSKQTKQLRELILHGSNLMSHAIHLYFLALPDWMGYDNTIQLGKDHPEELRTALLLKQLGNEIVKTVGGREVHIMTPRVGGFSKFPTKTSLQKLKELLLERRKLAEEAIKLFNSFELPEFKRETTYVALKKNHKYAFVGEDVAILSKGKLEMRKTTDYHNYLDEYITPHSTAKFSTINGESFRTGAFARMNISYDQLPDNIKGIIKDSNINIDTYSPYYNNLAQAIEMLYSIDRSIKIIDTVDLKPEKDPGHKIFKKGAGTGTIEAPRGVLYHHYEVENARVTHANIITPTAQNLKCIEDDIKYFLPTILDKPKEEIILDIERLIRAYDPCISCSTHFLDIEFIEKNK